MPSDQLSILAWSPDLKAVRKLLRRLGRHGIPLRLCVRSGPSQTSAKAETYESRIQRAVNP